MLMSYFLHENPFKEVSILLEEELITILTNVRKPSWLVAMMKQGKQPNSFETLEEVKDYYTQMYQADQLKMRLEEVNSDVAPSKKKRKSKRKNTGPRI